MTAAGRRGAGDGGDGAIEQSSGIASPDPRTFRTVLGQFCTGVTIITTVDDGAPVGFACQSFAALSLDPPLVLFCPTKQSRSWAAIERAGRFCVNVLAEDQQQVCARFGSREPDKFAGIEWAPSPLGSPILTGSLAHIDCVVESVHDGGDHWVVFGRVSSLSEVHDESERPLLFYRGQYTGIEPEKTTPAPWRDDLEAFLTTVSEDTWL
ncbi:MAG: flavin reductase family protein [Rhodococcus sp.]|uniref:3-hydroxy-9,10-secoandrosta-1,3,5(10)-triene-9, 17-dione monooxygenase reductase subunit n=2 Tax=Nocardiaceae TaxID=85025 RepID=UPI00168EEE28|nr:MULTISPECIES: 3-hydroxy-9,10-secoandrosta-1,3,5(10)-triene-9,17-dione monooxygenase reductase subunit [Rhodococcus]NLV78660.1 flavin reductase family protein [Rhodococcus sp. (in: high G+C Gram-positive bacteria)]